MVSPELLRRFPYFSGVSHETLRKLAMLAEERTFAEGETVFREWERADYLYIVLSGQVEIRFMVAGEPRTVDTVEERELLLWAALVEPYRTTGIGVSTRDTKVIAFEANQLRRLCAEDARLGYSLMREAVKAIADRLEGTRIQLALV